MATGLPHYRNSTASMNNYEPLYKHNFLVIVTPPPAVSTDFKLVLENVTKISGLDTIKLPPTVEQQYKGAKRTYAGAIPEDTTITVSLDFEVNLNDSNSAYVLKALTQWSTLIYDPLTGRTGLKKDYIGGPMIISAFNKNGDIYRQWVLPTVFPINNISVQDFEYGSNEIYKITDLQFKADYWEEIIL